MASDSKTPFVLVGHTVAPPLVHLKILRILIACAVLMANVAAAAVRDLESELATRLVEGRVPAAAAVVVQDDVAQVYTFGTARPDTPFRWGSVTKTFTALALLQAAESHAVALETRLDALVAGSFWENPFADGPIRLEHLLELTAGLPDLTRRAFDDNRKYTLAEAMSVHADSLVVRWPPGLAHSYSNATAGLTQSAVEAITGEPFEAVLDRRVFQPLGMKASLQPMSGLPGGYQPDGQTPIPYWQMTFRGFGALNTSISDMARFLRAIIEHGSLDGRRVWSREVDARLRRPHSGLAAEAGLTVGYASGIYSRVRDGRVWHGHGGDADGYRSRYSFLPEQGVGYALVINVDNPRLLRRLERLIETELTQELPEPAKLQVTTKKADVSLVVGEYQRVTARFGVDALLTDDLGKARVAAKERGLVFTRGNRETRLRVAGDGSFLRDGDPLPTVAFVEREGQRYLVGELGLWRKVSASGAP